MMQPGPAQILDPVRPILGRVIQPVRHGIMWLFLRLRAHRLQKRQPAFGCGAQFGDGIAPDTARAQRLDRETAEKGGTLKRP